MLIMLGMPKAKNWGGEKPYYHIYNRGVEKRDIFLDDHDRNRFLFSRIKHQTLSGDGGGSPDDSSFATLE